MQGELQEWATSEGFLAPALSAMYPEVEVSARLLRNDNQFIFRKDSALFLQDGIVAADSTFFRVFPMQFIHGDRTTALNNTNGIVISEEVSKKFFGNENPIGKLLSTDFATFIVAGVIAEIPETSHFHFKVVFPLSSWWPDADQSRNMYAFYSYVRLKSASDVEPFISKTLKDWYKIYGYVNEKGESTLNDVAVTLGARRLQDIHLRSHAEKEYESNGHLHLVYVFLAVAILILVVAIINYINLSNAMAMKRAREIGVKKTMGASWHGLFVRFLLESCAFTFLAFIVSFILVALLMPQFNLMTGKNFQLMHVMDIRFFVAAFASWLTIGVMAGTYPAIILSSFNPIQVLKSGTNIVSPGGKSLQFSHGLIILQFIISSLLIICTLTIREQLAFIESRDVGFNKSNVLLIPLVGAARQDAERIKTALSDLADVKSCAATSVAPGQRVVFLNVRIPDLAGKNQTVAGTDDGTREIRVMGVDHDFVTTLELTITDGRDFSIENAADEQEAFLINESAVRAFGLTDPVGRPFEYLFGEQPKRGKIIGVVKDFNFASVHSPVDPLMMHIFPPFWSMLCVRLKPDDVRASVRAIETKWTTITSVPFTFTFLDTTYDMLYRSEQTSGKVIAGLTFVALFIACLGLFAIVSFFVGQRTREVGLRKVMGATQASLFKTLSRKYLILVIVGNFIAFCPAWLLTDEWLRQFAYRIQLSATPFILALLISLALTIISMFYVVLKTVRINPANILRHE
jgi:putative ABC transport system permease protein